MPGTNTVLALANRPIPCRCRLVSNASTDRSLVTSECPSPLRTAEPMSFDQIPGLWNSLLLAPKMLWRIMSYGGVRRAFHRILEEDPEKFGQIYVMYNGSHRKHDVFLVDPHDYQKVYFNEGKYPIRGETPTLDAFYQDYGRKPGVFFAEGHDWQMYRDAASKMMLRPQKLDPYASKFDEVATDFVERIARLRLHDTGSVGELENLSFEAFKWAFESVSVFLYDRRMGTLSDHPEPEALTFLKNLDTFMAHVATVYYYPTFLSKIYKSKRVRDLNSSFDNMYHYAGIFIKRRLDELTTTKINGADRSVGFIPGLVAAKMTQGEILYSIVDIFFAGVDTTSNTLQWCLYELSKHAEVQEKLYQEIKIKLKETGGELTHNAVQEMVYLRAVIKETLRFYPVLVVLTRVLPQDMVLSGYLVPKGTTVHVNLYKSTMSEKYFPDPTCYRPERWLRSNETAVQIVNFAALPFGHGVRMCVGRRIAEMELSRMLARVLLRFRLTYPEGEVVEKRLRGITVPDRPPRVRFHDRI